MRHGTDGRAMKVGSRGILVADVTAMTETSASVFAASRKAASRADGSATDRRVA